MAHLFFDVRPESGEPCLDALGKFIELVSTFVDFRGYPPGFGVIAHVVLKNC